MTRFVRATIALVAVCLLAGCQPSDPTMARIKKDKQVVIATHPFNLPFEFGAGTEVEGFDVDIGNEIAKDMGVRAQWGKASAFANLLPMLESKEVDMVISAISVTPDLESRFALSEPYFTSGQIIAVRKDAKGVEKLQDLKGKRVGVQEGTTAHRFVEGAKVPEIEIVKFQTVDDALVALNTRQIDAVVGPFHIVAYSIFRSFPGLVTVGDRLTEEKFAVVLRREDKQLISHVNSTLKRLRESGQYEKIYKKWFAEFDGFIEAQRRQQKMLEEAKRTPKDIVFHISRARNYNLDLSYLDGFTITLTNKETMRSYTSTPILTDGASGRCQVSALPGPYVMTFKKLGIDGHSIEIPVAPEKKTLIVAINIARTGVEISPPR